MTRPGIFVCLAAAAWSGLAADLKPPTLAAFDRYVQLTEARMAGEVSGSSPFLWIDRQPDRDRAALLERLRRGEVVVAHLETRDAGAEIQAPNGLVHHWIGTVLVPATPIDRVLAFVQDYARYPEWFAPAIVRARVREHDGDRFVVAMRTSTKKMMVTVVIDADYVVEYRTVRPGRVWTQSVATHVEEVQAPGREDERKRPADQSSGYLWRLNNYCAFEQRPEGTYEQCESISLTRDLPFGVAWMIKPFVSSIPRETLAFTLGRVRMGAGVK